MKVFFPQLVPDQRLEGCQIVEKKKKNKKKKKQNKKKKKQKKTVSRFTETDWNWPKRTKTDRNGLTKIPNQTSRSTETGRVGRACICIFCFAPMIQWIFFSWHLPTVDCISCRIVHDWKINILPYLIWQGWASTYLPTYLVPTYFVPTHPPTQPVYYLPNRYLPT